MSCASIVSLFTHIICYLTGSLHPLVVLTLAIQFMVLWIANAVGVGLLYANDAETVGCAAESGRSSIREWSQYDRYDTDEELQAAYAAHRKSSCALSTGILAISVVITWVSFPHLSL